ncbi:MAG: hypothetical protein ACK5AY_14065 [Bacteroidota bacterium]
MKKVLSIVAVAAMTATFVACGPGKEAEEAAKKAADSTAAANVADSTAKADAAKRTADSTAAAIVADSTAKAAAADSAAKAGKGGKKDGKKGDK